MQLVDNDTFFEQLAALFEASKETGTIWLTHKRLSKDGGDVKMTSDAENEEYPCLVRATNGKQVDISTHVAPQDLVQFHAKYGTLLKSSMTTLRKRDKKREKQKAEEAARKKQRLAKDIAIEGPKRGAGRRKRQRHIKQAIKQEQTRKKVQEREEAKSKAKSV
ncbi:hypothetical protein QCA50_002319 [Cerrena zonata]|uniref:Signal recognition particle subunit SRP14 n=1 Tax=Cerrena zonata TaxID=2478898 RepID=A0AAW0GTD7_9APHY